LIDEYPRCSTAFQPLYAQTANIFGRRYLTILAVTLFTLGRASAVVQSILGCSSLAELFKELAVEVLIR
jgi:hypothetical protein